MTRIGFPVLIIAYLGLAAAAQAQGDWSQSFADGAAIAVSGKKVLVLAGASDPHTQSATQALLNAVRSNATLLLDSNTVGDQAGKADPEILAATKTAPVEIWVIVRAFDGDPPSAVLTIYDSKGAVLNALTFKKGEASTSGADSNAMGGLGTSSKAIDSIATVSDELKPRVKDYLERFLHLGQDVYINAQSGAVVGQNDVVYKGRYSKRLTNEEFYKEIADPELDKKVAQQRTGNLITSAILTGVGGLVLAGGIGMSWLGFEQPASVPMLADDTAGVLVAITGVMVATTGGIALWGGAMGLLTGPLGDDPGVLKPEELRQTIEQHNIKLKKELGLEDVDLPLGI